MDKRMISVAAMIFGLAACGGGTETTNGTGTSTGAGAGGSGGGEAMVTATSTGSATTSAAGTGGGAPVHPLEEGDYQGVFVKVISDSCGNIGANAGLAPVTLTWSSPTNFAMDYQGGTIDCTFGQGSGMCMPYTQTLSAGANVTVTVTSSGGPVKAVSTTELIYTETLGLDCAGSGCDAFATQQGTKFPCAVTGDEDYAQ